MEVQRLEFVEDPCIYLSWEKNTPRLEGSDRKSTRIEHGKSPLFVHTCASIKDERSNITSLMKIDRVQACLYSQHIQSKVGLGWSRRGLAA